MIQLQLSIETTPDGMRRMSINRLMREDATPAESRLVDGFERLLTRSLDALVQRTQQEGGTIAVYKEIQDGVWQTRKVEGGTE